MQCPPTPQPGFNIFTLGCLLDKLINSLTLTLYRITNHEKVHLQMQYLHL